MARWFNTAGECNPAYHYMVPAEKRLPEARGLIDQMGYFVVHAPRQTGKTTALRQLTQRLTEEGRFAALTITCEVAGVAGDDFLTAERRILADLYSKADALPPELRPPRLQVTPELTALTAVLKAWAEACPRPIVLVMDETDALTGESLPYVLRQLRAGHGERPRRFPWSIALCGLRDATRLGTSSSYAFNIVVESLRVRDFTLDEVRELYDQHTADTGQTFTDAAVARAFELSGGQPWLVNALARTVVYEMKVPPPEPITVEHVEEAKERILLERATHLDSLVDKLSEPRVKRIVEPLIAGATMEGSEYNDDAAYVRDLGLVAGKPLEISNPIYREVIVRVLSAVAVMRA